MRLVLVRHGETVGQSSIRYYGATDVPLSEFGRAQMRRARAALAGVHFDAVYASALARSLEGGRIVSGRDAVNGLSGFNEVDFGEWEGLTEDEIRLRDPERHALWSTHPADFQYPSGETMAAFRARITATLRAVLARPAQGPLLFVLHKGVIRTILAELLRLDTPARHRLAVDLGSIHIVAGRNGAGGAGVWRAQTLNRVEHL